MSVPGAPAGAWHPMLVAVAAALLAALTLAVRGVDADGLCWAGFQALLVVIAAEDLRTRRIRNLVLGPAVLVAIGLRLFFESSHLLTSLVAGALVVLVFLLIAAGTGGGFGMGDVKLAGFLGVLLIGAVLPALIAGTIVGGVASTIVLLRSRSRRSTIAYGPYLCLGAAGVILLLDVPNLI